MLEKFYYFVGAVTVWSLFAYGAARLIARLFVALVDRFDKTRFFVTAIRREWARRHNEANGFGARTEQERRG